MEKVRLTKAVDQKAIDFNIGGRSVIVGQQSVNISADDFQTITRDYPGWIERDSKVATAPAPQGTAN